jgi:hypothetical protein
MVYFQTKNPTLGNFWRILQLKRLVYFMNIWSILQLFGIFNGHLVYFAAIWYIFPRFGTYVVSRKIWQPWHALQRRFRKRSFQLQTFIFQNNPQCNDPTEDPPGGIFMAPLSVHTREV